MCKQACIHWDGASDCVSGAVAERTPRYISGRNSHLVGCSVRILKLHGWRKNKQTSKHTNRQTCKHVCMSIRFAGPVRCLLPPLPSPWEAALFSARSNERGRGIPARRAVLGAPLTLRFLTRSYKERCKGKIRKSL